MRRKHLVSSATQAAIPISVKPKDHINPLYHEDLIRIDSNGNLVEPTMAWVDDEETMRAMREAEAERVATGMPPVTEEI